MKTPKPKQHRKRVKLSRFTPYAEKLFLAAEQLRIKARIIERGIGETLRSYEYYDSEASACLELMQEAGNLRKEASRQEEGGNFALNTAGMDDTKPPAAPATRPR